MGLPQSNDTKAICWRTGKNPPIEGERFSSGLANSQDPPDKRETAAPAGTGHGGINNLHKNNVTLNTHDPQAACRAITAGLVCLPHPVDLGFILSRRLYLPSRVWLVTGSILSLPEDAAEDVCRATLAEIEAWRLTPHEREVERQRDVWRNHCARRGSRA
jgi:hypothetical protein